MTTQEECIQALNSTDLAEATAEAICKNTRQADELSSAAVPAAARTAFLVLSGTLVLLMQAGFAALVSGSVRRKNAQNLLVKNLLDMCFGALSFFIFGYWSACAVIWPRENRFSDYTGWFFQAVFAATAATIVSGAVAERVTFLAYITYAIFVTTFVYPLIVHWTWDGSGPGWLTAFTGPDDRLFRSGVIDFAGSGVVHGVGGFSALVAAWMVGPRIGRFDTEGKPRQMKGHSAPLQALGTLILVAAFIVFNSGSQLSASTEDDAEIIGRAATTTLIGIAAGGVTTLILSKVLDGIYELSALCNGMLSGAVAMCSGCSVLEPWAALLTGLGAGFVYRYSSKLLLKLQIDDPVDAAPVHGFAGLWGLLMTGLLASPPLTRQVYYDEDPQSGLLWGQDGGNLFGAQIIAMIMIPVTTMVFMGALFYGLSMLNMLRISEKEEEEGLDVSHHGGSAYEFDAGGGTNEPSNKA